MQPGGFYVVDRGYVDYNLFQELHDLPCSFLCRVKDNAAYEVQEERALAPAAVHAGVVRDVVLRRLGTAHHTRLLPQPFRLVQIATGKTRAGWDARRRGPGHESAGPGCRVAGRGVSLSVGGGGVVIARHKIQAGCLFFLVGGNGLLFKGQYVVYLNRPIPRHHDFFHQ